MEKTKRIYVKTMFTGYHQWTEAPQQVRFLSNLHRHLFFVEVGLTVEHSNRELEFFIIKNIVDKAIQRLYPSVQNELTTYTLGGRSCEAVCDELAAELYYENGLTQLYSISVSEDRENKAELIVGEM